MKPQEGGGDEKNPKQSAGSKQHIQTSNARERPFSAGGRFCVSEMDEVYLQDEDTVSIPALSWLT